MTSHPFTSFSFAHLLPFTPVSLLFYAASSLSSIFLSKLKFHTPPLHPSFPPPPQYNTALVPLPLPGSNSPLHLLYSPPLLHLLHFLPNNIFCTARPPCPRVAGYSMVGTSSKPLTVSSWFCASVLPVNHLITPLV